MSTVLIRRASAEDAIPLGGLYRELVDDSHIDVRPGQVAALAETATTFLLVAEVDGVVRATALLTICPDAMYGAQPFGVIENVIVARTMRGRGLGKRLMAHAEQLAMARNCSKLMLLSGALRGEAHAFFRGCGFSGDTKKAFVKYRSQFAKPRAE